ncbi:hypothetical protein O6H91_23G014700 [Diphasiastrum complanatum]|uniref:Uncharacterized protein n=1 Tax=Diphasiastrum complanatum TaxID=34168 RepID=A0ACC2A9N4_DIPCM|nr:hypothetical protein O6H91_23G014700 [Diphasiastrum complanatum]
MNITMTSHLSCSCLTLIIMVHGEALTSELEDFLRTSNIRVLTAPPAGWAIQKAAAATQNLTPAVTLSENALRHLSKLREEQNKDLCLRIGVRQGGCSGMSYVMDFEERTNIRPDDSIIDNGGFTMVCDPKSLLFLFGMQLDYSDALIGGGFSFNNPNATSSCGCGKSFAA